MSVCYPAGPSPAAPVGQIGMWGRGGVRYALLLPAASVLNSDAATPFILLPPSLTLHYGDSSVDPPILRFWTA